MSRLAALKGRLVQVLPDPIVFRIAPIMYRVQEPELARMRSFVPPGQVAVDIGGWLGPWTRELARWCPKVHTFEPQPDLAAYLRRVVPPHVVVHENAVADAPGVLPLVVPSTDQRSKALASLGREATEGAVVHQVDVVRLDDVDLGDVGFVKIDVEGREREVLEGARNLLLERRPRLLLEAEQRHVDAPLSELFDLLDDLGYRGWFLRDDRWHELAEFDTQSDQLDHLDDLTGPRYINNFLLAPVASGFVPADRP